VRAPRRGRREKNETRRRFPRDISTRAKAAGIGAVLAYDAGLLSSPRGERAGTRRDASAHVIE
jgi:hypothetical protein